MISLRTSTETKVCRHCEREFEEEAYETHVRKVLRYLTKDPNQAENLLANILGYKRLGEEKED